MDDKTLMRSGVIINPRSGRGRGKGVALAQALAAAMPAETEVVLLNDFGELEQALRRLTQNGLENLFISSGDGTIQAIQTWLAEKSSLPTMPRLCLLPHGTTNMTAADLGFKATTLADQIARITTPAPREMRKRHTLRVVNPLNKGPLHGMFFGTGAVADATRYCQVALNDKGIGGNWATFATLALVLGKSLFTKANPDDINRFDRPYDIKLEIEGRERTQGPQLLMLATTLNKLILGSKPFWGGATAPLRTTTLPYPVPNLWRWTIPTLFGSESRSAPKGASSQACATCDVTTPTQFVLDGEFYDAPQNGPLHLETGPAIDYIIQ